jgi:peptidoglycan hydrolase CwlO-like protein
LSQTEPHDEFLELCAVSTSGQLTEEEQNRLEQHLAVCNSCREALRQYQAVVDEAIPRMGAVPPQAADPGPGWSEQAAEKAFFQRLAREERLRPKKAQVEDVPEFPAVAHRLPAMANEPSWRQVWLLYAAGILLFLSLGVYAYKVGWHSASNHSVPIPAVVPAQTQASLEQELSDAGHERELARAQIEQRDNLISDLRRQLAHESWAIDELKASQEELEKDLRKSDASKQDLAQRQTELGQKLETAQNESHLLQNRIDSLTQQSAEDAARAKSLEARNDELSRLLEDREANLEHQDQLLAHDRDIRELMGARDLYIAEVYDVAGNGETKKPYGRVFYTRGKSLIFYAYDLDQQAGAKKATTFQAWGRRGPDREQALNLGIFYEDNVSRKRWILKCDDPKSLAEIDGVFVTLEPNGGSHAPSGKSLLFASLQINPNHP